MASYGIAGGMTFSPVEQRLQHMADSIKEYLTHYMRGHFSWLQINEIPVKVNLSLDSARFAYRMEVRCSDWVWSRFYDAKLFEEVLGNNPQYLDHLLEQAAQGTSAAIFNEWFVRLLTNDEEALKVYKDRVGPHIEYVIFGDGRKQPTDATVVRCALRNAIEPYVGNVAEIAADPRMELARILLLLP